MHFPFLSKNFSFFQPPHLSSASDFSALDFCEWLPCLPCSVPLCTRRLNKGDISVFMRLKHLVSCHIFAVLQCIRVDPPNLVGSSVGPHCELDFASMRFRPSGLIQQHPSCGLHTDACAARDFSKHMFCVAATLPGFRGAPAPVSKYQEPPPNPVRVRWCA